MAMRRKAKNGRGAATESSEAEAIFTRLSEDSNLREQVERLLNAAGSSEAPAAKKRKKRRLGFGKMIVLAGLAGGGALAASEGLRTKVLDLLFGAEEEFEYTPPTPPETDGEAATTPLSAV